MAKLNRVRGIQINYTSQYNPETSIPPRKWGADKAHRLLPFQIKVIQGDESKVRYRLEGLSQRQIDRYSDNGSRDKLLTKILFYPNDIETYIEDHRRVSPYKKKDGTDSRDEHLANIHFVYVDFDPKGDSEEEITRQRAEFLDKVDSFFLKPDVIVDSGNGLHAYWSVRPVHLLGQDWRERDVILARFKAVQATLCKVFGGDTAVVSDRGKCLRVPDTWNIKEDGFPRRCKYLRGDLSEARHSPAYTLLGIERTLRKEGYSVKPERKRYPKPNYDGYLAALNKFCEHFDIKKPSAQLKRTLKVYYGHRACGYFLEGVRSREKYLGTNGKQIQAARDQFLALGVIDRAEEPNFKDRRALKVRFTSLFYVACGLPTPIKVIPPMDRNLILEEVMATPCPKKERWDLLPELVRKLWYAGFSQDEIRAHLSDWIDRREPGLSRDKGEIDWLLRTFDHGKRKA